MTKHTCKVCLCRMGHLQFLWTLFDNVAEEKSESGVSANMWEVISCGREKDADKHDQMGV